MSRKRKPDRCAAGSFQGIGTITGLGVPASVASRSVHPRGSPSRCGPKCARGRRPPAPAFPRSSRGSHQPSSADYQPQPGAAILARGRAVHLAEGVEDPLQLSRCLPGSAGSAGCAGCRAGLKAAQCGRRHGKQVDAGLDTLTDAHRTLSAADAGIRAALGTTARAILSNRLIRGRSRWYGPRIQSRF